MAEEDDRKKGEKNEDHSVIARRILFEKLYTQDELDDIEEEDVEEEFPTNVCGKRSHPPTFQGEPR